MTAPRASPLPTLRPARGVEQVAPYATPRHAARIELRLDGNEGLLPDARLVQSLAEHGPELLRRYPSARALEALLAERMGVEAARVLVTAGADDALDRACRAMLAPGREMILPMPTFEMLPRYARLTGAEALTVPWPGGAFPTRAVLERVCERTAAIAVVSPNNPTGAVASAADLRALAAAAPHALLIVDLAYGDFADEDLTQASLGLPNAVVVRSFSKSWGLAGLRVGCAVGPMQIINWLRATGSPYAVSGPSIALAMRWLRDGVDSMRAFIARIRFERGALVELLRGLGDDALPSQGNFVFARMARAEWTWQALAGLGIGVRRFPDALDLTDALRITCPGDEAAFERLAAALRCVRAPQALLLDIDGVIADVGQSYRRSIIATAASFGVAVTPEEIAASKALGNANNDWRLTQRLMRDRGRDIALDVVTQRFESIYQGAPGRAGLRECERRIPSHELLKRLAGRVRLAVVTGRPRRDAERFLSESGVREHFAAVVCMEDGPSKPDPGPVRLALQQLGVERAWFVGDTPDDIVAARAAGVVPIGVCPPGDDGVAAIALETAGAARVLVNLDELEDLLP